MVFRRVNAQEYAALIEFVTYENVQYEVKVLGKTTLMFGLPRHIWRRLDYTNLASTLDCGEVFVD